MICLGKGKQLWFNALLKDLYEFTESLSAQIRKYTLLDMKFNQIGQQVNLKFLKDSKVNCAIPNYDWEFFLFNLQPVEISQVH